MRYQILALLFSLLCSAVLLAETIGEKKTHSESVQELVGDIALKNHVRDYFQSYNSHFDNLAKNSKNLEKIIDHFPPEAQAFFQKNLKGEKQLPKIRKRGQMVIISDQGIEVKIHPIAHYFGVISVNGQFYKVPKTKNMEEMRAHLMRKFFPQKIQMVPKKEKKVGWSLFLREAFALDTFDSSYYEYRDREHLVAAIVAMNFYKYLMETSGDTYDENSKSFKLNKKIDEIKTEEDLEKAYEEYKNTKKFKTNETYNEKCGINTLQEVVDFRNSCVNNKTLGWGHSREPLSEFMLGQNFHSEDREEDRKLYGVLMALLKKNGHPVDPLVYQELKGETPSEQYEDIGAETQLYFYEKDDGYPEMLVQRYDISGKFLSSRMVKRSDQIFMNKFKGEKLDEWVVDDRSEAIGVRKMWAIKVFQCEEHVGLVDSDNDGVADKVYKYTGDRAPQGTYFTRNMMAEMMDDIENCLGGCFNDPNCQDIAVTDMRRRNIADSVRDTADDATNRVIKKIQSF